MATLSLAFATRAQARAAKPAVTAKLAQFGLAATEKNLGIQPQNGKAWTLSSFVPATPAKSDKAGVFKK